MKNIALIILLLLPAAFVNAADAGADKAAPAKAEAGKKQNEKTAPAKERADKKLSNKSAAVTADQALAGLIAWDGKLKTLQADFTQATTFEGTPISSSEGRIYKQGQNIRLDTFENGVLSQSALTDKKVIKIKDSQGEIITTMAWADWEAGQSNKALFDFGNYGKAVKGHKIKDFSAESDALTLTLMPEKEQTGGYELTFKLDPKDFFVKEISLENEGVKTTTVLKGTQKNIKLKESIFK